VSSVRKFTFDESFDVDAPGQPSLAYAYEEELPPEPEPEPEIPPPPTFSQEELDAARQQGYAEGESAGRGAGYGQGFADGRNAGIAEGDAAGRAAVANDANVRLANALDRIAAGVANLIAERNALNAVRRDQPVHIALAIVRKLFPELSRRGGAMEVEGMVRTCLTELMDEPRLVVRCAEDMLDPVRERLEPISGGSFGAKLMIVGDPALAPGDCRIEWAEGGAERSTATLMAEVEACVARLLEAPAPT